MFFSSISQINNRVKGIKTSSDTSLVSNIAEKNTIYISNRAIERKDVKCLVIFIAIVSKKPDFFKALETAISENRIESILKSIAFRYSLVGVLKNIVIIVRSSAIQNTASFLKNFNMNSILCILIKR